MVAVALIVLLLVLLLTVAFIVGGGDSLTVDLFGAQLTTSGAGVYVIGLISGAVVALTLWLLRVGLRKTWKQRKRIKDLERRADRATPGDRGDAPDRADGSAGAEDRPPSGTAAGAERSGPDTA